MTQTFFVEHIGTPTGRMRLVSDDEQRLRAVDWDDHEPRMLDLLRRHYGADTVQLSDASRPSKAARALLAYFDGAIEAVADLPTATNGTKNHRLSLPLYRVWSLEELV
jgi:methylated-DNA-[protein]-cysteine S-methyltransferase